MQVVRIRGGQPLNGEVIIGGAKNACLPMFAAALLTDEPCILHNVPDLSDIRFMADILAHLGAQVTRLDANTWSITARDIHTHAPYELVRKMRASVCLLGPLVGRMRQAQVSLPGGCVIGQRPIDLHLKGLARLGCDVTISQGYVYVDAKRLQAADVFLGGRQGSTVTGTANLLMAAVLAPGVTHLESAACEPEIVDLCHLLVSMGAHIEGIGSHALTIEGVDRLSGYNYRVVADRIQAGTFIAAGLMAPGGTIQVKGVSSNILTAFLHKLEEAQAPITVNKDTITVKGGMIRGLKPIETITLPYPGFPTDLQAQMCAMMTLTEGISIVTERIYPNRFMHVPELQRMGADISIEGASAIINGVDHLSGAPVMASDLRASAALYLAALAAVGETWVQRIYHLDRGYDRFDEKLRALGADIVRMEAEAMPVALAQACMG